MHVYIFPAKITRSNTHNYSVFLSVPLSSFYFSSSSSCDCRLTVYDHINFGGRSLLILQQNALFINDWFNDRVESAVITGSCVWIFYEDKNFNRQTYTTGNTHILQPGRYNTPISWGGPGNHISSARVLPPDGTIAIALFQHADFEGRMMVLYESDNHFKALDFNDEVHSVIITGGTWKLYEHSNYQGEHTQLSAGHYPNLQTFTIGNDEISSV